MRKMIIDQVRIKFHAHLNILPKSATFERVDQDNEIIGETWYFTFLCFTITVSYVEKERTIY